MLVVRSIVAARLLGPLPYGAWNAIQLIMDYGTTLPPIGTQQGLDQSVPARIVAGDTERLERIERAGLFNILVLTALFGAGFMLYALFTTNRFLGFWGAGWLLVAIAVIVMTNLSAYHMTLLRSHGNIGAVSGWFFLQGVVGTVLGVALIPAFGVRGLLGGWVAGTLVATIALRLQGRRQVPIAPRLAPESLDLVRVGLPMFVFIASTQVMRSFDRLIILKFLGTLALGYYSVSVNALTFMLYLPDSIAYVLYPRLLREYGRHAGRPEAIRAGVERALGALAVIVPALCGVAYLLAREAVAIVLPKFLPGVTPLRVLCFGAGGLALANLASIVLMTLRLQNVLVASSVAMTLIGATLDYVAVRAGFGINGVARMTLITYVVYGVTLLWLALRGLGAGARDRVTVLVRALVPLLVSFVYAYALDKLLPLSVNMSRPLLMVRLIAGVVAFGALYSVSVIPFVRGLGLAQVLREFNLPLPWAPRGTDAPPA